LHPTIPQAHPNGYFSTESDYLMVRPDSHTRVRQSGSSDTNDQYLHQPKLNFNDTQQQQQHQHQQQQKAKTFNNTHDGGFYQS
jgi:hypothetical protein